MDKRKYKKYRGSIVNKENIGSVIKIVLNFENIIAPAITYLFSLLILQRLF